MTDEELFQKSVRDGYIPFIAKPRPDGPPKCGYCGRGNIYMPRSICAVCNRPGKWPSGFVNHLVDREFLWLHWMQENLIYKADAGEVYGG